MALFSKLRSIFSGTPVEDHALQSPQQRPAAGTLPAAVPDAIVVARPEQQFWQAFSAHAAQWRTLEARALFDATGELLRQYIPDDVVAEVQGDPQKGVVTLVFSCNGDTEHFGDVLNLVKAAPALEGYAVVAFRQRTDAILSGTEFQMGEVSLSCDDMVAQLGNSDGRIGITLAFTKSIPTDQVQGYRKLAMIALDHLLGEWTFAVKVGAVVFVDTAEQLDPNQGEAIPLKALHTAMDVLWAQGLGHTWQFPKQEDHNISMFTYHSEQADSNDKADVMVMLNTSANAVACRADFMHVLHIQGDFEDQQTSDRIYQLDDAMMAYLHPTEQGIFAFRRSFLGDGYWQMFYYVQDPEAAVRHANTWVAKVFPHGTEVSVTTQIDPCWDVYLQFASVLGLGQAEAPDEHDNEDDDT